MNLSDASDTSKVMAEAVAYPPNRNGEEVDVDDARRVESRVRNAVFSAGLELMPNTPTWAVVDGHDRPTLAAFHENRLYLLTIVKPGGDFVQAEANVRSIPADPARSKVALTVRYLGQHTGAGLAGQVGRVSTWTFSIDGEDLVVPTETYSEGTPDRREVFAQELAAALGWDFPNAEAGGLKAAA